MKMNASLLEIIYICPTKTTTNFYTKIVGCRLSTKVSQTVK